MQQMYYFNIQKQAEIIVFYMSVSALV